MNRNKKNARKQLFADRSVQGALMLRITRQWLCFFAAVLIALPAWELILSEDPLGMSASEAFINGLKHTAPVFVLLLALIPAFVWDTMKLSHRFAGPMRHLRSAIRAAANGEEIEPLKFRDGDFWREVPDDFNRILDRLRCEKQPHAVEAAVHE